MDMFEKDGEVRRIPHVSRLLHSSARDRKLIPKYSAFHILLTAIPAHNISTQYNALGNSAIDSEAQS